jgi:hypothetical protein
VRKQLWAVHLWLDYRKEAEGEGGDIWTSSFIAREDLQYFLSGTRKGLEALLIV